MRKTRPWRAAAYWPFGGSRVYMASTSALTREALGRFVASHEAAGEVVDVWCVQEIPGVSGVTQPPDSPTR